MTRWRMLVGALAVLGLPACGPQDSDAGAGSHKPGEPRVVIRPAEPRDPGSSPKPSRTPRDEPPPVIPPPPPPPPPADPQATPVAQTQVEVFFGRGRVGRITADRLEPDLATYHFDPTGSFASVELGQRLLDTGRAEVSVHWQGEPRRMFAVAVTDDTIDLTPHRDPERARQARSYFPLVPEAVYEFQGLGGFPDVTYVLGTRRIGFVKWHYMGQRADDATETLAQDFLCRGAFQKGADGVLFVEAKDLADLDRDSPGPRQVLLRLPPRQGWSTRLTYNGGASTQLLRITAFESITVPAGTFDNCARIRLEPEKGHDPARTFWLAPGVGVVMMIGDDGRGFALAHHELP